MGTSDFIADRSGAQVIDNLGLWLASEVGSGLSCRPEPLTCGI